jgi:hypothetical protein
VRRIRILVVLIALVCTILGGASAATVSAGGPAVVAPATAAGMAVTAGKRWG